MQAILNEEKEFYAKINENIGQVEKNGKVVLTKFLTLREQQIVENSVKYSTINSLFYGGFDHAERKRCLLYPKELTTSDKLFNITCFKISYNKRYLKLTHQNVLGTLMSMQIDRSLFGDIIFDEDECYFFVSQDIEHILLVEFKSINRVPINLEKIENEIGIEPKYDVKEIIISSMRIDNIISHVYNLSRDKTKSFISSNFVSKNFQVISSQSTKCEVNDVISVRKHGRFIISKILRYTKSDKIVLEVKIPST